MFVFQLDPTQFPFFSGIEQREAGSAACSAVSVTSAEHLLQAPRVHARRRCQSRWDPPPRGGLWSGKKSNNDEVSLTSETNAEKGRCPVPETEARGILFGVTEVDWKRSSSRELANSQLPFP